MSALPPIADINDYGAGCPLLTQSGLMEGRYAHIKLEFTAHLGGVPAINAYSYLYRNG